MGSPFILDRLSYTCDPDFTLTLDQSFNEMLYTPNGWSHIEIAIPEKHLVVSWTSVSNKRVIQQCYFNTSIA